MGVTAQRLSKGLDCGLPLVEKTIKIHSNDSLKTLKTRAFKESEDMMYTALIILDGEKVKSKPLDEVGKLYTFPNLRQWMILTLKVISRKVITKFKC